jgi:hypothetical protein
MIKLFEILDRGGLKYPSDEFISRLWTLYVFIKSVLPLLVNCSLVKCDLKNFLLPKMKACATFLCELALPGETNDELLECILDKFLTALLHNQCLLEEGDFIPLDVHPANKNRRMKTLRT